MPRFASVRRVLVVECEGITLHLRWTVEHNFRLAAALENQYRESGALLEILLDAISDWEGVEDEQGQPLPYSRETLLDRIPAARQAGLCHAFVDQILEWHADPEKKGV